MASGSTIGTNDIPPEILNGINCKIVTVPVFNREAQNYRKLVNWILEEKKYLKGKQCKEGLKNQAKQINIWRTKTGFVGIGRGLINAIKTDRELFQDIDREGIKNIFDLLFLLVPNFKKEKGLNVEQLLKNWSIDIESEKPSNQLINSKDATLSESEVILAAQIHSIAASKMDHSEEEDFWRAVEKKMDR